MDLLTTLLQDLRLALRRLTKTPGFSALAIVMLTLALAAHLAIVGLIEAVFLRPLPLPEPDRLLSISETRNGIGFRPLAYLDFANYRSESRAFSDLATHYSGAPLKLDLGDISEMIHGSVASANLFSVMGVEPAIGRFFLAEEDATPDTHPVAVVSDALWRNHLGGDERILGSVVKVNNVALTVIGVAPPGFGGLLSSRPTALWMPTMMTSTGYRWCDALGQRDCRIFDMVGRLAPGSTARTAQAEMDVLSRNLHLAHPTEGDIVRGLNVAPLSGFRSESGLGRQRMAGLLLTIVTLVLVVAGANLSGLLIGRGLTRRREIAVRLALGAPRRRVVSLFVAEAMLLSIAGGVGGVLVAHWAAPLTALVFPSQVPRAMGMSPTVLGYSLLLCALTGLIVGLAPGLQSTRPSLTSALKDSMDRSSGRPKLIACFVVVQIAISFVLLSATGLLARSVVTVGQVMSVDPAHVATLRLRGRLAGYDPNQGQALVREVVRRLEAIPGVHSVGFGQLLPLWPGYETELSLPGGELGEETPDAVAGVQPIGPGTFESLAIPLQRGRDFDTRDVAGSKPVVLVNHTLAKNLWPDEEAVGQRIELHQRAYEVVGVVRDSAYATLMSGPSPQVFTAYWQDPTRIDARILVRALGDAAALLPTLRQRIHEIDSVVPVTEVMTLEQRFRDSLSDIRMASGLTGVAGALAVFLSAMGLAGVLALAVASRVREIGIRRALGAGHVQVMTLVVRDAMILVCVALACGLAAATALGPLLRHFLHGVSPRDPWILGSAFLLLAVISAVASWWPARRAAGVDPMVALRQS